MRSLIMVTLVAILAVAIANQYPDDKAFARFASLYDDAALSADNDTDVTDAPEPDATTDAGVTLTSVTLTQLVMLSVGVLYAIKHVR